MAPPATAPKHRPRRPYGDGGFTLLEVMIAVGILGMSMSALLTSQVSAVRATRYAQRLTSVAFLGEYAIVDIEWRMQKDGGWVNEDRRYEGNFSDLGWAEVQYNCLVDFLEIPEYSKIRAAKDAKDRDTDGNAAHYQDAGDKAFSALALVWPMVKAAIEQSIRKVTCKITWPDGREKGELSLSTYWTDPEKLSKIPKMGGEAVPGEDDDGAGGGAGGRGGGAGGRGGSGSTATGMGAGSKAMRPESGMRK
ncbi:MAG: type II secretion system protein [Nannocystaceae bacterium]